MTEDQIRMAAYIEREVLALVDVARQTKQPMLAYYMERVAAEASDIVRQGVEKAPKPEAQTD